MWLRFPQEVFRGYSNGQKRDESIKQQKFPNNGEIVQLFGGKKECKAYIPHYGCASAQCG